MNENNDKFEYSLIAAVPDNWVIGNGLKIPWYIPEDFKLFKERTLNSVIIMGQNTWDSLPFKPLPKRVNIVLNRDIVVNEGAVTCTSFKEAFNEAKKHQDMETFIIGGASIYSQTIKDATYLYISHVKGSFEGDILFPKFDKEDYEIIEEIEFEKFTFIKYRKL